MQRKLLYECSPPGMRGWRMLALRHDLPDEWHELHELP